MIGGFLVVILPRAKGGPWLYSSLCLLKKAQAVLTITDYSSNSISDQYPVQLKMPLCLYGSTTMGNQSLTLNRSLQAPDLRCLVDRFSDTSRLNTVANAMNLGYTAL